jgi:hypothetical protein
MRQMPMNIIHDIVDAGQHLVIPVTDEAITQPLQRRRSLRIIARLQRMLTAVDLDHQLGLRAQKVDDIAIDRHLPPKTKALDLSCAQAAPQALFGIGHGSAQLSGTMSVGVHEVLSE